MCVWGWSVKWVCVGSEVSRECGSRQGYRVGANTHPSTGLSHHIHTHIHPFPGRFHHNPIFLSFFVMF